MNFIRVCCVAPTFLLTVTVVNLLAQSRQIDSLQRLLFISQHDTMRIALLNSLAETYCHHTPQQANEYALGALRYAERNNNSIGKIHALMTLGRVHFIQARISQAQSAFQQAMTESKRIGNVQTEAWAICRLADIEELHGHYGQARRQYDTAEHLFRAINDEAGIAATLRGKAWIALYEGRFDVATEISLNASRPAERTNDESVMASVLLLRAMIYINTQNTPQALSVAEEAVQKAQKTLNLYIQAQALHVHGTAVFMQQHYDTAWAIYEKALAIHTALQNKQGMAYAYYMQAIVISYKNNIALEQAYQENILKILERRLTRLRLLPYVDEVRKGFAMAFQLAEEAEDLRKIGLFAYGIAGFHNMYHEDKQAQIYAHKALEVMQTLHNTNFVSLVYDMLYRIAERKKDYKQAFLYHQKFKQYSDSLYTEQSSKAIAEAQAKYDDEKRQQQIQLLEKEHRLDATIRNALIAGGASLLLIVIVVVNRYRIKHRAEAKLREQHQLLEVQSAQIQMFNAMLMEQTVKLEELNAEKSELMHIVAHDLKNPLGGVRSLAELIAEGYITPDDHASTAAQIVTATDRMTALVKNMLGLSAIESGKVQFSEEVMDVRPIIAAVVDDYAAQAAAKNMTVFWSSVGDNADDDANNNADDALFIQGDGAAFRQIIDNLLSNALKYSPAGKRVWIDASFTAHNPSNTRYVRIEIKDEGPGLTEDDKNKLFGKFARLSAKPTGGEHSTGLGLAIVKRLVDVMDGRVWCESLVGKGAAFVLEFPAVHDTPVTSVPAPMPRVQHTSQNLVGHTPFRVISSHAETM
jgi:signal transduction histidine kinase